MVTGVPDVAICEAGPDEAAAHEAAVADDAVNTCPALGAVLDTTTGDPDVAI